MSPSFVVVCVDDLLFYSKIQTAARLAGMTIRSYPSQEVLFAGIHSEKPSTIIFDLDSRKWPAIDMVRNIKSNLQFETIACIGFCAHVNTQLMDAAHEAGFDQVFPRSKFSTDMSSIISAP